MTLQEIIKLISEWIVNKQTGSIQINFCEGGISNTKLNMCIRAGDTIKIPKIKSS